MRWPPLIRSMRSQAGKGEQEGVRSPPSLAMRSERPGKGMGSASAIGHGGLGFLSGYTIRGDLTMAVV